MKRTLLAALVALPLFAPASARADVCGEEHESCVESCTIDHGMAADRKALNRCLVQCDERREDCYDLKGVERRRRSREPVPEERDRLGPPDVRRYEGEQTGTVRPIEDQYWEPADTTPDHDEGRSKEADDAWLSLPEDKAAEQREESREERRDDRGSSEERQQEPPRPPPEEKPRDDSGWDDFGGG